MKLKEIKPNGIGTVECVIVTIEEKTNRNNGTVNLRSLPKNGMKK